MLGVVVGVGDASKNQQAEAKLVIDMKVAAVKLVCKQDHRDCDLR
jgi:hypothetical protein